MHVISFLWLHWSWFEKFTVAILYVISFLCMKFWMWALYKMSSSYCHSHHHHHPHHQHHHQQEGVSPTTTHLYLSHSGPLIHLLKTNLKENEKEKNRMLAVLLHHVLHLPRGGHVVHLLQPTSLRLVQQCIQVLVKYQCILILNSKRHIQRHF